MTIILPHGGLNEGCGSIILTLKPPELASSKHRPNEAPSRIIKYKLELNEIMVWGENSRNVYTSVI